VHREEEEGTTLLTGSQVSPVRPSDKVSYDRKQQRNFIFGQVCGETDFVKRNSKARTKNSNLF
jgi:hypothetical protein